MVSLTDSENNKPCNRNSSTNSSPMKKESTNLSPGQALASFSDFINDNLVVFRFGTTATVAFLTAYGLSQTPIFFRYKKVVDIPKSCFSRRKTFYGRIVHVVENDMINKACLNNSEKPIICLVRHTSPFERILNRSAVEFFMRNNPSSHLKKDSRLEDAKDLLKVEIAGVREAPSHYDPNVEGTNIWLKRLARHRAPVSCTLLSRRIINSQQEFSEKQGIGNGNQYRKIIDDPLDDELEQAAVCHLKYRPPKVFFRKDLGSLLIENGRAEVASGVHIDIPTMSTVDGSTKLGDMQADIKYLEMLVSLEMKAVKERSGIWAIEAVREKRPELVNEAEFEMNASFLQKMWRRFTQ